MPISSIALPISYHGGHSGDFCDHAAGTKAEMLEAYIARGFTHVGIVEHMPPYDDRFVYEDERKLGHDSDFLSARFERYLGEVKPALHASARGRIDLMVGLETEYYGERPIARVESIVNSQQPDFVVASVHHVNDIPIDYNQELYNLAVRRAGSLDELFATYYDHQFDLLRGLSRAIGRNRPVVVGHFDLIKIFSPTFRPCLEVKERVKRNIETAVAQGFLFEVNARAYRKGLIEPYPGPEIFELIQKLGGRFTVGDDAHSPDQVGNDFDKINSFLQDRIQEIVAFENSEQNWREVTLQLKESSRNTTQN